MSYGWINIIGFIALIIFLYIMFKHIIRDLNKAYSNEPEKNNNYDEAIVLLKKVSILSWRYDNKGYVHMHKKLRDEIEEFLKTMNEFKR